MSLVMLAWLFSAIFYILQSTLELFNPCMSAGQFLVDNCSDLVINLGFELSNPGRC
jgi:hypothetical protein